MSKCANRLAVRKNWSGSGDMSSLFWCEELTISRLPYAGYLRQVLQIRA